MSLPLHSWVILKERSLRRRWIMNKSNRRSRTHNTSFQLLVLSNLGASNKMSWLNLYNLYKRSSLNIKTRPSQLVRNRLCQAKELRVLIFMQTQLSKVKFSEKSFTWRKQSEMAELYCYPNTNLLNSVTTKSTWRLMGDNICDLQEKSHFKLRKRTSSKFLRTQYSTTKSRYSSLKISTANKLLTLCAIQFQTWKRNSTALKTSSNSFGRLISIATDSAQ